MDALEIAPRVWRIRWLSGERLLSGFFVEGAYVGGCILRSDSSGKQACGQRRRGDSEQAGHHQGLFFRCIIERGMTDRIITIVEAGIKASAGT